MSEEELPDPDLVEALQPHNTLDNQLHAIVESHAFKKSREEITQMVLDLPKDAAIILITDYYKCDEGNEHYGVQAYSQNCNSVYEVRGLLDSALDQIKDEC